MTKKKQKRIGRGGYEIEDLGDVVLSPEQEAEACSRIEEAEAELTATSVNFRWHKEHLAVVKRLPT